MKSPDFIKQQILEIEDFDSISDELRKNIESNDEYRALFENLRKMSETVRGVCPSPEKDGISLRDAVMKRVSDGDTVPRYINTRSYRFPFATVACLAVFAAVVLMSRSGYMQKNFTAENAADMNYSPANIKVTTGAGGAMLDAAGDYADEEAYDGKSKNGREIVMFSAAPKAEMQETEDAIHEAENTASDDSAQVQRVETTTYSELSDEPKETQVVYDYNKYKVTNGTCDQAVTEKASVELSEKALLYIAEAETLCADGERITPEQIVLLGEEKYIEFFESISGSEDFSELYSYENFKAFCRE